MADARDLIRAYLNELGLTSESDWAIEQIIAGRSAEAVQIELESRPSFQARFPGYQQMKNEGRAVSVGQWLAYEAAARGILHAAGVPSEVYDQPEDVARWIRNDVSVAELQQRVAIMEDSISSAFDAEQMRLYGQTPGTLIAGFLDEQRAFPVIKRQYEAARASTIAARSGFGVLDVDEAERVGQQVSPEQAAQGFQSLTTQRELLSALDAGETDVSREDQIGAVVGDANAVAQIETKRRRRAAAFSGGGGYALGREGFSGTR